MDAPGHRQRENWQLYQGVVDQLELDRQGKKDRQQERIREAGLMPSGERQAPTRPEDWGRHRALVGVQKRRVDTRRHSRLPQDIPTLLHVAECGEFALTSRECQADGSIGGSSRNTDGVVHHGRADASTASLVCGHSAGVE